jgi:carbon-monoxide dehydrogenase large subunit
VEGQIHGGIAQGMGAALMEELVHDGAGQLVTGSFMDYGLPRAEDLPPLEVRSADFPSPRNELGIKGVGESGIISPGAAIANAVEDALADRGVLVDALPVIGARIFAWLREAGPPPG